MTKPAKLFLFGATCLLIIVTKVSIDVEVKLAETTFLSKQIRDKSISL